MTVQSQPHGVTLAAPGRPPEWFPFRAFLFVATIRDGAGARTYGPLSMN